MKKSETIGEMLKLGVVASILSVAMPAMGFAEEGVSSLIKTIADEQLPVLPFILSTVCYIGGSFMMVSGALSLKKHAENPASEPMGKGVSRLLTGGLITAVPALTGVIQNTVFSENVDRAVFQKFDVPFTP